MKGLQVRGGAVLMWRLGPLKPARQDRWHRAPEPRGLWALPWPYMDLFLCYGQYTRLLPKRLKNRREAGLEGAPYLPADPSQVETRSGKPVSELAFDDDGYPIDGTTGEDLVAVAGWSDARDAWVNGVGRRVLPIRKFWYSGPLYTHIAPSGQVGSAGTLTMRMEDTDWFRMDAVTFAQLVRKNRGAEGIDYDPDRGLTRFRYSIDHLEVFIPAKGGRIS